MMGAMDNLVKGGSRTGSTEYESDVWIFGEEGIEDGSNVSIIRRGKRNDTNNENRRL